MLIYMRKRLQKSIYMNKKICKSTEENVKNKTVKTFTSVSVLGVIVCLLVFSKEIRSSIVQTLGLSVGTVIPSLFPMLVVSDFAVRSGILQPATQTAHKFANKVFGISVASLPVVFFGLTGGFLTGIKTAVSLYETNVISEKEAQKLCTFCISPGLAFCIATVGDGMLHNKTIGILLLLSCTAASLVIGLCGKKTSTTQTQTKPLPSLSVAEAFTAAVAKSAAAMLSLTAWMAVFAALQAVLFCILPQKMLSVCNLFFEVTNAAQHCVQTKSFPLCAAAMGFGGLCIFFQMLPDLQKIHFSPMRFLFFRVIHAVAAGCFYELLSTVVPAAKRTACMAVTVKPFSASPLSSFFLLLACLIFVLDLAQAKKTWYTVDGR